MSYTHPKFGKITHAVRAWDFASTKKKKSDSTASCLMLATSRNYRLVYDVTNEKLSPGERDVVIRRTAERDGRKVTIVIEKEGGSSGDDVIFHYTKLLREFNVIADKPVADKWSRAQQLASWTELGLVWFYRAEWFTKFKDQLVAFPNGEHDDMLDATAMAFNRIQTICGSAMPQNLVASGVNVKPMTNAQIVEMSDGPLKQLLQHARGIKK